SALAACGPAAAPPAATSAPATTAPTAAPKPTTAPAGAPTAAPAAAATTAPTTAAAATTAPAAAGGAASGTLRYASADFSSESVDPNIVGSNWQNALYDTLLTYDQQGNVIGNIAEKYSLSADGLTWTF